MVMRNHQILVYFEAGTSLVSEGSDLECVCEKERGDDGDAEPELTKGISCHPPRWLRLQVNQVLGGDPQCGCIKIYVRHVHGDI